MEQEETTAAPKETFTGRDGPMLRYGLHHIALGLTFLICEMEPSLHFPG